jgi:hypothetical protein
MTRRTSTQVLAILLADLHADIAKAQASIDALATQDGSTGPLPPLADTTAPQAGATAENGVQRVTEEDQVLDEWGCGALPPSIDDILMALTDYDHDPLVVRHLKREQVRSRLTDAALTLDTFWWMRGLKPDGSMQQFNAVLTLALGPDAPQFVAHGDGWALVVSDDH